MMRAAFRRRSVRCAYDNQSIVAIPARRTPGLLYFSPISRAARITLRNPAAMPSSRNTSRRQGVRTKPVIQQPSRQPSHEHTRHQLHREPERFAEGGASSRVPLPIGRRARLPAVPSFCSSSRSLFQSDPSLRSSDSPSPEKDMAIRSRDVCAFEFRTVSRTAYKAKSSERQAGIRFLLRCGISLAAPLDDGERHAVMALRANPLHDGPLHGRHFASASANRTTRPPWGRKPWPRDRARGRPG